MRSLLTPLLTCALLALPSLTRAEPHSRALSLRIQCRSSDASGKASCANFSGWFEGRLDWRSGGTVGDEGSGTLLFSEFGRFYALRNDGEVLIYADGNGIPEDFEQRYLTPGPHNVLMAADLRVVLYQQRKHGDFVLLTDQRFTPVASAAWARYAEEALRFKGELKGDVVGPQGATRVVAVQGVPVAHTPPGLGQELRFNGSQWVPTTPSRLTAGPGLQGGSYDGQGPATFGVVFGTGPGTVTEGSDARLPSMPGAAGQLLYSNGASWVPLAPGAGTQVLHGGTTPSWGPVSLEEGVSGVLEASKGGTGLADSGAAGNFLRSTGSGWSSSPLTGSEVPSGSTHYIQNQDSAPQPAGLWIGGIARVGALQVGGGTVLQRVQVGTLDLNPPGRCERYPLFKCNYTYSLSFPQAFSSVPTVIVTPRATCSHCGDTFSVTTKNVSEWGFDVVVTRTDPSNFGGDWGQTLQIDFMASN